MQVYLCSGCGARISKRGKCASCKREHEQRRGSAHRRGYGKQHQRLAAEAIRLHPFCAACGTTKDLTADHILPKSRGGLNALSNYEVLCRSCNSSKGSIPLKPDTGTHETGRGGSKLQGLHWRPRPSHRRKTPGFGSDIRDFVA